MKSVEYNSANTLKNGVVLLWNNFQPENAINVANNYKKSASNTLNQM